jgi:hypothetical protein
MTIGLDTDDDILRDNECNGLCFNDVLYGNGNESCRSIYDGDAANADAHGAADTQSAATDDNSGTGSTGEDISTAEFSGFDSSSDNLGVILSFESWKHRQTAAIKCPDCSTPLQQIRRHEPDIDYCNSCKESGLAYVN